ncbi:MAG TPA: Smr/MutS family protein [Polyangiaceae bacterium LLY-WYZ-15_(1-7)]|nr:endonuclease MutS2 [Myxococcales bacterium]MAT29278.1 endonuclease MutS2 [Sandaracinus sp.]HJK92579.1 Smr/MutS family protein [Polyangiaceae bacterium LLY-WYZ-15_(1-7)]MBJ73266.1 endonuclease MutS2 [Sandaracinus sp.]HJL05471.1 Smr/MutS family protein [Polyangiaceae bacterium LLY-WYZ-15_(1-7)]
MTPKDPAKTLEDLEWARIVDAVGARCRGPLGARMNLPLATTREGAARALAETREVMELLAEDEVLPLDGVQELRGHLQRLSRQGDLDAGALRDVMKTLAAARSLRLFLAKRKERMPALHSACAFDPSLDRLHEELSVAIDPDGTLSDHASPELRRLRGETSNLRERLVRRLDQILIERADILQDSFYTLREGRYVVPVRRDAHEKFEGIVHGTSSSGQSIFVEPRALVAQGNRLKMAQAELEREEARILAELSELVRERLASLRAACDALDHADRRQASARFGRDLDASVLPLAEGAKATLKTARHPLLLLDEDHEVVPSDLSVEAGRGLVISGPNAGGKTVALKNLGLAALMQRAGLPIPAAPGSSCGFFAPVLTDVGDEQSIEKNLSTFSAHVTNLARILKATGSGSLVLLDELAGGTDPQEGAALACALVDTFVRRGAALGVTTHYEPLKAMAAKDERLENAAVGFDVEKMEPTFELLHGVPGASSALAVARRFGIPDEVLATARGVLPEQSRTFDELVRQLEDQRRELALAKAAVAETERELLTERAKLKERRAALEKKKEKLLDGEAKKLRDMLRRAREDVRQARRLIKKRPDENTADEVRRRIEEAAKVAARRPADQLPEVRGEPIAPEALHLGVKVWVPRLRAVAEVVEGPVRDQVRVAAGALRLWVDVADLTAPPKGTTKQGAGKSPAASEGPAPTPQAPATPAKPVQTPDNTLDVRGLRVDEALAMAESFLDRMYGQNEPTAFIVHGIGSGALRDAIRGQLRQDSTYVQSFRGGTREEGGDRTTIVTLR